MQLGSNFGAQYSERGIFTSSQEQLEIDSLVNSNIPFVQTNIATGINDSLIYPIHQGDSIRLRLEGNCKVVAKGADNNLDQAIFDSGYRSGDYLVNKYRVNQQNQTLKCFIDNSHTSQLYSVDSYVKNGLITPVHEVMIEIDEVVEEMTLNLTALQDLYLVIFNRGRAYSDLGQSILYAKTWFTNYTIEQARILVEGIYNYVVPRATLFIGDYLLRLLQGYLFPNLIEYVNNAYGGQIEYRNSVRDQQPIIEDVEDAIVPI